MVEMRSRPRARLSCRRTRSPKPACSLWLTFKNGRTSSRRSPGIARTKRPSPSTRCSCRLPLVPAALQPAVRQAEGGRGSRACGDEPASCPQEALAAALITQGVYDSHKEALMRCLFAAMSRPRVLNEALRERLITKEEYESHKHKILRGLFSTSTLTSTLASPSLTDGTEECSDRCEGAVQLAFSKPVGVDAEARALLRKQPLVESRGILRRFLGRTVTQLDRTGTAAACRIAMTLGVVAGLASTSSRLDDLERQDFAAMRAVLNCDLECGAQASPSAKPASAAELLHLKDVPAELATSLSCRKLLSSAIFSSSAYTSSRSSLCSLSTMQAVNPRDLIGRASSAAANVSLLPTIQLSVQLVAARSPPARSA
ncbi:hypothetical protein T492DRAFT_840892 [Pavlovales sp. CCMP2436]|nr:hypothetical protein T492DRAFT_840892 [Pavlovales sp. CCMP2436]